MGAVMMDGWIDHHGKRVEGKKPRSKHQIQLVMEKEQAGVGRDD